MKKHDIIVIGGSAGSLSVLKEMVKLLPAKFPAAIFIVWHLSSDSPGILPDLLRHYSSLPASNAYSGQEIKRGEIYIAPPDHHLLINKTHIHISKGPKENRFRPAIDPLFRSAADAFGSRVIGIILSGGLDDGVAGLWTIKEYGGITVVQDPVDAENPSMPLTALKRFKVDHCVPSKEIADLLIQLCNEEEEQEPIMPKKSDKTEIETSIASGDEALLKGILELGKPSYFTCPDCHGVLIEIAEGNNIRFRCHTGHAYSSGTLLSQISESIEDALWNAVRMMNERILLLNHLSDHLKDQDAELSSIYAKEAQIIQAQTNRIREITIERI